MKVQITFVIHEWATEKKRKIQALTLPVHVNLALTPESQERISPWTFNCTMQVLIPQLDKLSQ